MSIEQLEASAAKPARFIVGLMSGSSCDGVDAALVRVKGTGPTLRVKLIASTTIPYVGTLRQRLLAPKMDTQELRRLNSELAVAFAEAVTEVIAKAPEADRSVDFIASHGHTVAHIPPAPNQSQRGTLQIADPAIIANKTSLPVVSDFRPRDMAAGGQGAPLVPYADWALFQRKDETLACLNIGGIANLSILPPKLEDVFAFDTGPGNMPIDGAVRILSRGRYLSDENGVAAAKGTPNQAICEELLSHPYFVKQPPKSTGREEFGAEVYLIKYLENQRGSAAEDLIATVTYVVARSIALSFQKFVFPLYKPSLLIVSGGGVHNTTLMNHLRLEMATLPILTSDELGLPGDAREAIAFAILGNETVCGNPSNVPGATGASHPAVLGKISLP